MSQLNDIILRYERRITELEKQLESTQRMNEQWEADYAACLEDLGTAQGALREIVRLHDLHPTRVPYILDIARRGLGISFGSAADLFPASEPKEA